MRKGVIPFLIVCLLTFNCSALADNLTTEILPMDIGVYNGETKLEVPTYSDGTTVYVPLEKLIQKLGGSYEVQGENIVISIASETDSQSTVSDDADTISSIKNVVLFDKDGVKAYFTGKFREDNMLLLEVIIENQTNKNLDITYKGKANGWNLGSDYTIENASTVHSDSKAKGYLWFLPGDIGVSTCLDIESLDLIFEVRDADTYKEVFTVETGSIDLKNGATAVQPTEEPTPVREYALGETVYTDMIEFTLTGFDFVYGLEPRSYVEKDDIHGGSLGPGKDMVFANPEYVVKNIGKNELNISTDIQFTIDYNNGYQYGMNDGEVCYLFDSPYAAGEYTLTSYIVFNLSPLCEEDYEAYIPANKLIDTDTNSPLKVIVCLKSTNGEQEFIYRIR